MPRFDEDVEDVEGADVQTERSEADVDPEPTFDDEAQHEAAVAQTKEQDGPPEGRPEAVDAAVERTRERPEDELERLDPDNDDGKET